MRRSVRVRLEAAWRAMGFCRKHPGVSDAIHELELRLGQLLSQADALVDQEQLSREEMQEAAHLRAKLAVRFRERSELLLRLSATVAEEENIPELRLRTQFRAASPGAYLRDARHALDVAIAYKALLLRYGMPAHMFDALNVALDDLQEAHDRRRMSGKTFAAATVDLAAIARQAVRIVRHLDTLQHFRFAAAPKELAEWRALSAVRWGREGEGETLEKAPPA